jgi:hypothetical protein
MAGFGLLSLTATTLRIMPMPMQVRASAKVVRRVVMNQLINYDAFAILCNGRPLPVRGNMHNCLPLLKGDKFGA